MTYRILVTDPFNPADDRSAECISSMELELDGSCEMGVLQEVRDRYPEARSIRVEGVVRSC